jgi:xanthine dehydrogenase accessory factor
VTGVRTGSGAEVLRRAAALVAERQPFALATVTWRRGPSSGKDGCRAVVHPDGRVEGWLGGACAEPTVVREALGALQDGASRLLVLGATDLRPGVVPVPMACASEGAMEVFVEPVLPEPRLWIVGSSPAVTTLATLATGIGWDVRVVDQLEPAGPEDSRGGRSPVAERPTAADLVVVATQGHADEPALAAALAGPAWYVGLVASGKRADAVRGYLLDSGLTADQVARLRAPAGLDLGPVAHHEIAVAVLAELVALRAGRRAGPPVPVRLPEQAVDPVCGMTVDVGAARFRSERTGTAVYFCAAGCLRAFERDPAAFPLAAADRGPTVGGPG